MVSENSELTSSSERSERVFSAVPGEEKIALIVLAAGASKRMPDVKQLLPWKKTFLLGHIVEQGLASAVDEVLVVLGAHRQIIAQKLDPYPIKSVINKNWKKGMGTSISAAVKFMIKQPIKYKGMLICLADQPLVSTAHLDNMVREFSSTDAKIVITAYQNVEGVPTLFHRDYFELLLALEDDMGAKEIIRKNRGQVRCVASDENFMDIDTSEDYRDLVKRFGS